MRLSPALLIVLASLTLAGCHHRRTAMSNRYGCPTGACAVPAPPPPGAFASPGPAAFPTAPGPGIAPAYPPGGSIPPGGFAPPQAPPGPGAIPGLPPPPGGPLDRAAPPGPSASGFAPAPVDVRERPNFKWEPGELPPPPKVEAKAEIKAQPPTEDRVLLLPPEFDEKREPAKKDQIRLYPPEPEKEKETSEPPSQRLPVGIPDFATARDQVSVGRRPSLDDGLDWLQSHRYKTIVHLRLPGETSDADRKQIEKRGFRYVSLEVNPRLLTRDVVEEFLKIVSDRKEQPVFVYDQNGALSGAMFYLLFRIVDQDTQDVAQVRAGRLGLQPERSELHREMWAAVQNYLRP
jgi:protein tyrosine phosphatase (PTP) superfamily phosphohydrolase (DUF442 family)